MQIEGVKIGGFFGGGLKRLTAEARSFLMKVHPRDAEVLIRIHRRDAEDAEILKFIWLLNI